MLYNYWNRKPLSKLQLDTFSFHKFSQQNFTVSTIDNAICLFKMYDKDANNL